MTSTSLALAGLLLLGAFASLASEAQAASACTDLLYDSSCASTLCVVPTAQTGFCTTRSVCVVGETRCIGHLACVGSVCVPDPCYTTACAASGPQGPIACTEVVGSGAAGVWCQVGAIAIGPIRTCDTCAVLFSVTCHEGTDGVWCQPDGVALAPVCFLEIVGPDLVLRSCLDPSDPDCLVYTERWGKEGEYLGKSCVFP